MEFALTITLVFGFVFFFTQLALVFTYGSLAQYATFQSARAYLSASARSSEQAERARNVAVDLLKKRNAAGADRYPSVARGVPGFGSDNGVTGLKISAPGNYDPTKVSLAWLQGVRYQFRGRLFVLPLGGRREQISQDENFVTLTSESWLGREPSVGDCENRMGAFLGGIQPPEKAVLYDNGC